MDPPGEGFTGWNPRMERKKPSSGPEDKTHGFVGYEYSDSSLKMGGGLTRIAVLMVLGSTKQLQKPMEITNNC